ncbi:MAG: hypothetical protein JW772_04020 [Candidatus Diapherotrites archaeon]|nr:hypothetical protein [Candidatus Diapherotrites archaeon]
MNSKRILPLLGILVILVIALYFLLGLKQEGNISVVPPDAIDCGNSMDCLRNAAENGEKAMAFIEEEPVQYTIKELRQFENQGIEPPEREGALFSHLVKECNEEECTVAIRIEKFPSDTPDFMVQIMQGFRDMECRMPAEDVGTFPEDISNCSGPYIEGIKILEGQYAA